MPSTKSRRARTPSLTAGDLKHLFKNHLTIRFDKAKDQIEIGWACSCRDKSCDLSHISVAFYSCPFRPCPPIG